MGDKLIKEDVIGLVCSETGYRRKVVENVVDSVFGNISQAMIDGRSVQFVGFGTFGTQNQSARTARNPRTNEQIIIPPRRVPVFKAGKHLKNSVINVGNDEKQGE